MSERQAPGVLVSAETEARRGPSAGAVLRALAPAAVVALLGVQGLQFIVEKDHAVALWLVAAQSVPLILRARLPLLVLVMTVSAAVLQMLVGLPDTNANIGQAVAATTVVSRLRWPWSVLPPTVALAANMFAAWLSGQPGLGTQLLMTGASLLFAWVIGDAARRRATVSQAIEDALRTSERSNQWRARLSASDERLRIAQELHQLVGEALDAIVVQAGAARLGLRSGRVGVAEHICTIESIGRDVLVRLDHFLALLRSAVPVEADGVPRATKDPVAVSYGHHLSGRRARLASVIGLVGPAMFLVVLAVIESFSIPSDRRLDPLWILLTAWGTLPLLVRRRWPWVAAVCVTAASAVQLLISMPIGNGVLAIPVAAHALAVHRSRRAAIIFGTVSTALLVALGAGLAGFQVAQLGVVVGALTGGAIYVGDAARMARQHDDSLLHRVAAVAEEGDLRARAAAAAERTQAARDLHDSLGHTMSLIMIQTGAARLMADRGTAAGVQRTADALTAIENSARSALSQLDARAQRDADDGQFAPGDAGLIEDLPALANRVRSAGIPVDLRVDARSDLSPELQSTVFRLIQESFTNVLKHAPGAATDVRILDEGGLVRVTVTNQARTRVTTALPSGSRGLTGMRERVLLLGGSLAHGPDADGGYRVAAILPVANAALDRVEGKPE